MYEEELRNLQNDLNQKDQKISQLEKEQKQLYKKYKSLKGKSKGNFGHLCWTFSPARWSQRWKIALETPPEILWRIFWCNKIFWDLNFQHPIKREIDRKWRNAIGQLGVWTNEHTLIIVIMPVNWQKKVRASTQKKAQLLNSRLTICELLS